MNGVVLTAPDIIARVVDGWPNLVDNLDDSDIQVVIDNLVVQGTLRHTPDGYIMDPIPMASSVDV